MNRELRKQPTRFAPEPAIDTIVQDAWAEDPVLEVHHMSAREGDTYRAAYGVALRTALGSLLDDDE